MNTNPAPYNEPIGTRLTAENSTPPKPQPYTPTTADNPLPTRRHLDAALKLIKSAQTDEQARRALDIIIEYRDWTRDND